MTESNSKQLYDYVSLKSEIVSILSSVEKELSTKLGEVLLNRTLRNFYYKKVNPLLKKIYEGCKDNLIEDKFFEINKYFKSIIYPISLVEELENKINSIPNQENKEEIISKIFSIIKKLLLIFLDPPYEKSIKKSANNISKSDIYKKNIDDLSFLLPILSEEDFMSEIWILNEKQKEKIKSLEKEQEKKDFLFKILNKKIYNVLNNIKKYKSGSIFSQKPVSDENFIEIRKLNKIYSSKDLNVHVIKDLSLEIKKGEFVLLLGPSGSGKTTLMNMIAGIDDISYGDIIINGLNISLLNQNDLTVYRKNNTGYIYQRYALIPNLTVGENIRVGSYISNRVNTKNFRNFVMPDDELDDLLNQLDLYSLKDKYPYQLSGGQQQRVAIARTIAKKPSIIFADEPTSALDEASTKIVIDMLKTINKKLGITIIMITHNEKETSFATRIIRMRNGNLE